MIRSWSLDVEPWTFSFNVASVTEVQTLKTEKPAQGILCCCKTEQLMGQLVAKHCLLEPAGEGSRGSQAVE